MKPSRRILEYRRWAEMLQVQPCAEHARLFILACEQDDMEYEERQFSPYESSWTESDQVIMQIGELHRPSLRDHPETWVRKASATLHLIRTFLTS